MLDSFKTLFQNTETQFEGVDIKYIALTQDVISVLILIFFLTAILSSLILLMYGKEDEVKSRTLRSLVILGILMAVGLVVKVVLMVVY